MSIFVSYVQWHATLKEVIKIMYVSPTTTFQLMHTILSVVEDDGWNTKLQIASGRGILQLSEALMPPGIKTDM